MSTISQTPTAWRSQELRTGWQKSSGLASRVMSQVLRFFTTYPPLAQGLYYLALGLWPLIGIDSYQQVTGHAEGTPWLAQAVGILLIVDGIALCLAAYRRQGSPEVLVLAFGTALGLAAVDIHLVWRGFSALYILDAAVQLGLVAFWVYGWRTATHSTSAASGIRPSTTLLHK